MPGGIEGLQMPGGIEGLQMPGGIAGWLSWRELL